MNLPLKISIVRMLHMFPNTANGLNYCFWRSCGILELNTIFHNFMISYHFEKKQQTAGKVDDHPGLGAAPCKDTLLFLV